jgi:hypothetical protein
MILSRKIFVTFEKEGIHCYPEAGTNPALATGGDDDVSFLSHPHRHIFKFKVQIEVFNDDRDLEFIQLKRQCEKWLGDGTMNMNRKSCEMLADDLHSLLTNKWPNRNMIIEVSEDGENGAITEYGVDHD